MTATVTIEQAGMGDKPWAVIITRPGAVIPRSLWDRYATQGEAMTGAEAARAYLAKPRMHNASAERPLPQETP